jgi:hypothetical protein
MKFLRVTTLLALVFGLTPPAASAWELNDSEVPGSVIVFHKFIRGTFVDVQSGATLPRTQFEINITCPKGASCDLGQFVRLRAHWVCPPNQVYPDRCPETDFDLFGTVNGTIVFNPEQGVPPPPCDRGYLIAWVIDTGSGEAIKFDGLIGDAVLRDSQTSARAYNALPIQASENLNTGDFIDTSDGLGFDGNEYKAVTGKIFAPVAYNSTFPPAETSLTLLTLDVLSNRDNPRTEVGLYLYDMFEQFASSSRTFTCWDQFPLTDLEGNPSQNLLFKGHVESTYAQQNGTDVTLIGIVETLEGFSVEVPITAPPQIVPLTINVPVLSPLIPCPTVVPPGCTCSKPNLVTLRFSCNVTAAAQNLTAVAVGTRDYSYSMYHNSEPVSTTFVP